jgi:hypothetical protein
VRQGEARPYAARNSWQQNAAANTLASSTYAYAMLPRELRGCRYEGREMGFSLATMTNIRLCGRKYDAIREVAQPDLALPTAVRYLRVPTRVTNCYSVDAAWRTTACHPPSKHSSQSTILPYVSLRLHRFPAWVPASGILGEIGCVVYVCVCVCVWPSYGSRGCVGELHGRHLFTR